jgi:hypothetical protein
VDKCLFTQTFLFAYNKCIPSGCALVKKYVQLITYTVYLYDISVDIIKGLNFIKFVCLPFLCIFYAFSFLFLSSINILFSNKT